MLKEIQRKNCEEFLNIFQDIPENIEEYQLI